MERPRREVRFARLIHRRVRVLGAAIGATKVTPVEVTTDQAPVYLAVLEGLLPAPGTARIGMPTTGSSVTTAG